MMKTYTATILRDAYGAPHVFADTEPAALYGFGYAQAEDRLETLLAHYLSARGAAASILGASYLERDIAVRAYRLPEIAHERYNTLPDAVRDGIEAFVAGINRYQSDSPAKCPRWAFPIQAQDVVGLSLAYNLFFATDHLERSPETCGSNGFAVAKTRTARGNTIVSLDPHLPFSGALRWYEGRISGGEMNIYGVTFAGLPYIVMGCNGNIAWANTVNAPDLSDLYEIRMEVENGKPVYEYDGEKRSCDVQKFSFTVRQEDGSARTIDQNIVSTHHGPILKTVGEKKFAVRKAGIGDVDVLTQVREQGLATSVDAYRAALSGCHMVMFNHLFGDATGEVGYVSAGQVPRRPGGFDFHAPVPGWTSETEWGTPVSIDELPQAIHPKSGFVQNCNDTPGNCGADDMQVAPPYPEWLAPDLHTLRGEHMQKLLRQQTALTPEGAMQIATDVADLNAHRELPALLEVIDEGEPKQLLGSWNRELTQDAVGAALFQAWLLQPFVQENIRTGGYLVMEHVTAAPLAERFPQESAAAFRDALEWLAALEYPIDVEWGILHRLERGTVNLPMDGGLDSLCPNGGRCDEQSGIVTAAFGSSYRCVAELTKDEDPRLWACLPWGNSDDPQSPHYADQLPLAAKRGYRPVPWAREAVEKEKTAQIDL